MMNDDDDISQLLVEKNKNAAIILFKSINADYYVGVAWLLENGTNVNIQLPSLESPLHLAVRNNKDAIVELLLSYGANVDKRDDEGCTPLHLAVQNNKANLVELLLRYRANVEKKDNEGCTPLHHVCNTGMGKKISKRLLEFGANINETDNQGWTPLHHAIICENKPVIKYFWQHKYIDINAVSCEGETPLQLLAAYNIQPILDTYLAECIDSCIGAASDEQIQYCKATFKIVLLENPNIDKPKNLNQPAYALLLLSELADSWDYLAQEVKNMQNKTINAEYSFHTLCLTQNPENLKDLINDESNISKIENYDLKTNFPNYSNQIIQNLEAAKKLHQKIASSDYSLCDIYQENDNDKLLTIFSNPGVEASVKQLLETPNLLSQFPVFFKEQLQITLPNKLIGKNKRKEVEAGEVEEFQSKRLCR
ncbi:MAG: ankyrin repeat domain-containing protein [Rickettsia endosymbiont of Ixodes persulcatus]|nr:ankyrin repeat domain-containing protein [Rickettsia endosymbiont of Ixodes persulcatus]